jgi:hypothetical protein
VPPKGGWTVAEPERGRSGGGGGVGWNFGAGGRAGGSRNNFTDCCICSLSSAEPFNNFLLLPSGDEGEPLAFVSAQAGTAGDTIKPNTVKNISSGKTEPLWCLIVGTLRIQKLQTATFNFTFKSGLLNGWTIDSRQIHDRKTSKTLVESIAGHHMRPLIRADL